MMALCHSAVSNDVRLFFDGKTSEIADLGSIRRVDGRSQWKRDMRAFIWAQEGPFDYRSIRMGKTRAAQSKPI